MDKYDKLAETIIMDDLKRLFEQHSTPSKELDALKRIETCAELGIDTHSKNISDDMAKLRSDISIVQQALKHNEPMKPIYEKDGTRSCPCCKGNWLTPNFKFCSDCGQKLDWSDEK